MKKQTVVGAMLTFFIGNVCFATSAPMLKRRCSEDSLEPAKAAERVEWAAKCGHITANEKQYSLFDGSDKRPRPLYPIYGLEDMSQIWIAPVDRSAPCTVPPKMEVVAFCTSSCYTAHQEVLFPEGFVEIKTAREQLIPEVMALRDNSKIDDLRLVSYPVESYTEEIRPIWQEVLRFHMWNDDELEITPNHPLVDQYGEIKRADKFVAGEPLIHYQKGPIRILAITREQYFGKVYNLAPASRLPLANVVIAQGYLNGSSYFQNDGEDLQNRQFLRRTIPVNRFGY